MVVAAVFWYLTFFWPPPTPKKKKGMGMFAVCEHGWQSAVLADFTNRTCGNACLSLGKIYHNKC